MHPRVRLTLISLTALVVAALAVVVLTGGSNGTSASNTATGASGFAGAVSDVPAANFSLADQDGRQVSLDQFRGQVVILTFLYSTCRDTCPLMAQQIRGALDQLGHQIPAIAVSVDPVNDTPISVKRFLFKAGLTGRMLYLTGTRAQLARVWKAYGIAPQTQGSKQSDHSAFVLLIDGHERNRVGFPADQLTPEGLAHDVRKLQSEAA